MGTPDQPSSQAPEQAPPDVDLPDLEFWPQLDFDTDIMHNFDWTDAAALAQQQLPGPGAAHPPPQLAPQMNINPAAFAAQVASAGGAAAGSQSAAPTVVPNAIPPGAALPMPPGLGTLFADVPGGLELMTQLCRPGGVGIPGEDPALPHLRQFEAQALMRQPSEGGLESGRECRVLVAVVPLRAASVPTLAPPPPPKKPKLTRPSHLIHSIHAQSAAVPSPGCGGPPSSTTASCWRSTSWAAPTAPPPRACSAS